MFTKARCINKVGELLGIKNNHQKSYHGLDIFVYARLTTQLF